MTQKPPDWIDKSIMAEATSAYARLLPATYAEAAPHILNAIHPEHRQAVTRGLRALSNNLVLLAVEPHGIVCANLFNLVTSCEALLRPTLRALVEIAAAEGLITDKKRLAQARTDFGMMLATLTVEGRPVLEQSAPLLLKQLDDWQTLELSGLRNAVAHFNFQIEIESVDARDHVPPGAPPFKEFAFKFFENVLLRPLGLKPAFPSGHVPDVGRSVVRFESKRARLVSKTSRTITVQALRDLMGRVESVAAALQLGFVSASETMIAAKTLVFVSCTQCKQSNSAVAKPSGDSQIECPVCGHTAPITPAIFASLASGQVATVEA